MVGKTVAHYEILEKIGEGGMGVVYKATDSRLGRSVAIKLLRESFLQDTERLARFQREARVLASLNHAGIAAIHGLEEEADTHFLVLEYVPGDTLAQRLGKGPLPQREALDICRQVAEALESAHEKGIIHRDLKPGNIKVTEEGKVKVLDFGLAKALEPEPVGETAETVTEISGATRAGVVLGTAPYMSPEQARGKPLDSRTDIWSFGCVLYETLTGKRTFQGETTTEVLAGILEREPDWSRLPATVPENVKCLLRRCLQKEPHCRLRSIGDARIELEETLAGRVAAAPAVVKVSPRRAILAAACGGLLLGVAGTVAWVWNKARIEARPPVVRFSFDLTPGNRIAPSWNSAMGFSPDGKTLAYSHTVGGFAVTFLRRLDELDVKPLSVPRSWFAAFSPDGRYLMLWEGVGSLLKKAALSGGAPILFANCDYAFRGDWAPDNYYYWTDGYFGPIIRTPASGGKTEPVTQLDLEKQERAHRDARMLPGGKALTLTVSAGGMDSFDDARIDVYTLGSKRRKTLVQGGFSAKYSPSGHLVYARGGNLYAVPFSAGSLEVTGSPVKVAEGVFMSTNAGSAYFDVSTAGALAYAVGKAEAGERTLLWVDRQGKETPLSLPARPYLFPRISPDGRLVAFEVEGVNHDLYLYDPAREVTTKLTTDGVSHAPVWTPDGQRLAFRSWKAGTMTMWWMPADRSAPEERLTMEGARQSLVSFSPDGRYAAFNQMETDGTMTNIWALPLTGDRKPQPVLRSKFSEGSARFSPDGKWVAYCTNESGRNEVFVQSWPGPGPKIQISSEGGTDPIWSRNGKELYYRNGDKMMVVAVSLAGGFQAGRPRLLWEGKYSHGMSSSCGPPGTTEANYDVASDGQRFLMVKDLGQDAVSTRIVVVLNFAEELKRLATAVKSE